jgi:hypothetical protein
MNRYLRRTLTAAIIALPAFALGWGAGTQHFSYAHPAHKETQEESYSRLADLVIAACPEPPGKELYDCMLELDTFVHRATTPVERELPAR